MTMDDVPEWRRGPVVEACSIARHEVAFIV